MKLILFVSLFVACTFALKEFGDKQIVSLELSPAINKHIIASVNNDPESSWVAGENDFFKDFKNMKEVSKLMGWKDTGVHLPELAPQNIGALPTSFSSAAAWKNCSSITQINNQARCGSCWAFGAVESITDRFCIEAGQKNDVQLSFEDVTSCDDTSDGCDGGSADSAWSFAQNQGIVSAKCYPYTVPTCPPAEQPCLNFVATPPCKSSCVNGDNWQNSLHFVENAYNLPDDADQIAAEIQKNGPVEACFSVYGDFPHYKSGVYVRKSDQYLGGHCVKIVGWGVEGGLPYWEINNSWTTYWGNKGTFKILRGQDECGIESSVVAGTMKL